MATNKKTDTNTDTNSAPPMRELAIEIERRDRIAQMTWAEYARFIAGENWKAVLFGAVATIALQYVGRLAGNWYNNRIPADAVGDLENVHKIAV